MQDNAGKEKAWRKINEIDTSMTFYTKPLRTIDGDYGQKTVEKEEEPLHACPV